MQSRFGLFICFWFFLVFFLGGGSREESRERESLDELCHRAWGRCPLSGTQHLRMASVKSSLIGPEHAPSQHLGRLPGTCSLAVARRRAPSIRYWQPLPDGGCNLPAASTFPLVADCSSAELNGDLWFFLFLITGQPCLPDFSEAQTRFLPRAQFLLARPAGPAPVRVP